MNHKRRRPKNQRAGCLMCKPHKMCGAKAVVRDSPAVKRANLTAREQLADDGCSDYHQVIWEESEREVDYEWDEEHHARRWYPDGRLLKTSGAYAEGPFATIGDAISKCGIISA